MVRDQAKRRAAWTRWYEKNKLAYNMYCIEKKAARKIRRKVWLTGLKSNLCCRVCGEQRLVCLDFHHIDPTTKKHCISRMHAHYSQEKIEQEIAKCEVLCANCHRVLHYGAEDGAREI